ncbi:hypothetical protein Tco_0853915 [Tanacetum coccineum]
MNDETMWAADRVVASNPSSTITIPEIANNFAIKEAFNSATGGIFLYKTPNQAYQLLEDKVLLKLDWAKNQKPKPSLKKTIAFADEGSSNSDIDKIIARMDAMTMKMDAQYKGMQSHSNHSIPEYDEDDKHMVCPIVNALVGRLLGAYDLRVATPRALVHAGDKTSGDARSWYMINGDAKS